LLFPANGKSPSTASGISPQKAAWGFENLTSFVALGESEHYVDPRRGITTVRLLEPLALERA
jgi:hypothetical protein